MVGGGLLAKVLGVFALAAFFAPGSSTSHLVERSEPEHSEWGEHPTSPPITTATSEGDASMRFEGNRKEVAVHLPKSLALRNGDFDLVIHFHGPHAATMEAFDEADLGAAIVSVNLGEGGTRYGAAAADPGLIDRLVAFAEHEVGARDGAHGARVGRIALSSWSAGFGAVREILKRPHDASRVDAVLLADGLFTDWSSSKQTSHASHGKPGARDADFEKVQAVVDFAKRATEGQTLFVLTHTSIDRHFYPDAPRTAAAMLRQFDVARGFPDGLQASAAGSQRYATDSAGFHVWGFGGKTWADHLAQHRMMGSRQFAALKAFWRNG
jgi:hypothetical protein